MDLINRSALKKQVNFSKKKNFDQIRPDNRVIVLQGNIMGPFFFLTYLFDTLSNIRDRVTVNVFFIDIDLFRRSREFQETQAGTQAGASTTVVGGACRHAG